MFYNDLRNNLILYTLYEVLGCVIALSSSDVDYTCFNPEPCQPYRVFYVFVVIQAQLRRADFRCLFNRCRSITNTFSLLLHD